jgi:hypothetical protein
MKKPGVRKSSKRRKPQQRQYDGVVHCRTFIQKCIGLVAVKVDYLLDVSFVKSVVHMYGIDVFCGFRKYAKAMFSEGRFWLYAILHRDKGYHRGI